MPLTLPTHPIAVLPLKLWRPRWFDGVALVVGAVAPDIPYALDGYPVGFRAHAWLAPLWWAVPLALLAGPVIRWSAPVIAAHVPGLGAYGVLARVRHRWWITAWSAAIGAYSHILWDSVTHATINHRPIPLRGLTSEAMPGWPWFEVLSKASDALGLAVAVGLAVHIGRSRLLVRWHGPAPALRARPVPFWGTFVAVVLAGGATLPYQPYPEAVASQLIRCLWIVCAGLVVAAAVAKATGCRDGVASSVSAGMHHSGRSTP